MVIIELESKNGKSEKKFKNSHNAHQFLIGKGYVYDDINHYYWRLNPMFGWLMKAKIV